MFREYEVFGCTIYFSGACVSTAGTPWSEDGGREFPVPSGATGSQLNMKNSVSPVFLEHIWLLHDHTFLRRH